MRKIKFAVFVFVAISSFAGTRMFAQDKSSQTVAAIGGSSVDRRIRMMIDVQLTSRLPLVESQE